MLNNVFKAVQIIHIFDAYIEIKLCIFDDVLFVGGFRKWIDIFLKNIAQANLGNGFLIFSSHRFNDFVSEYMIGCKRKVSLQGNGSFSSFPCKMHVQPRCS